MNHTDIHKGLRMSPFTNLTTCMLSVTRKRQTGASLIVSLMLLIVLTLLGLSGMQSTIMQERMSSNVRDKGMAFQAAESAIRGGEDWVKSADTNTLRDPDGTTCSSPPCDIITLNEYASMTAETFGWWQTNARAFIFPSSTSNSTPAADPHFIVEFHSRVDQGYSLDPGDTTLRPHLYRITAMGVGSTTTAEAMIETLYSRNDLK